MNGQQGHIETSHFMMTATTKPLRTYQVRFMTHGNHHQSHLIWRNAEPERIDRLQLSNDFILGNNFNIVFNHLPNRTDRLFRELDGPSDVSILCVF